MVWLKASYQPTTLFSLRPSWATSSGGKSLLVPSPYALKLALLDVALRTSGHAPGKKAWPWIRDLQIGIQLPEQIVVTNLFAKILKLRRNPADPGSADAGPFQKTIGYREYVYHPEPVDLIFGVVEKNQPQLQDWLVQVNYWGKRGGFVQLLAKPEVTEGTAEFIMLTAEANQFPKMGLVQQLDDCDPKMKFEQVDIYNKKRPLRITRHIILPYRLTKSSRAYSLYERVANS
ncbi:MAG: hypothetical protein H6657_25130 [Ardenticatenaceae bacterium]|nr:hypothetical protein [Ardenticatenaceae bacterium]